MKLESAVVITKGFCFVAIGAATPAVIGLAQWIDSGQWPPAINWIGIGLGSAVGAATQLLAFLSQSFGDYKSQMKSGDTVANAQAIVDSQIKPYQQPAWPAAKP